MDENWRRVPRPKLQPHLLIIEHFIEENGKFCESIMKFAIKKSFFYV